MDTPILHKDDHLRVIDTTIVSHLVSPNSPFHDNVLTRTVFWSNTQQLILSEAVIFEVERGLKHKQALAQLSRFITVVIPMLRVVPVYRQDWSMAATVWAEMRQAGRQFSDVDLLLAAITLRVDGVLVTADVDFAAIPLLRTENWLLQ